jgi:hypothetical protein
VEVVLHHPLHNPQPSSIPGAEIRLAGSVEPSDQGGGEDGFGLFGATAGCCAISIGGAGVGFWRGMAVFGEAGFEEGAPVAHFGVLDFISRCTGGDMTRGGVCA